MIIESGCLHTKGLKIKYCIPIHIPISSLKVHLDSYCNNYQIYVKELSEIHGHG